MEIARDEISLAIVADGQKGDTGPQGPKGNDGSTYYTWIKYADSPTSGMSDNPSGKAYIGIAYNKTSATESTTYTDYSWSKIKGENGDAGSDGNGIATITQYYARTTTFTKPSADAITATSPPALDNTYKYLWLKEVISFTKTSSQTMITLIAARGENGEMSAEQIAQLNKAAQDASAAVSKVDNLQIGGRNLAKEANIQYTGTTYSKAGNAYTQMCGNSAGIKFPADMFEEDQKYVLSFKFQKLNSVALTSIGGHCQMFQTYKIVINGNTITQNSTNWGTLHTITDSSEVQTCEVYLRRYKESEATSTDKNLYIQPQRGNYHSSNDIQVKIWDIKIETGDKPTDWSPAPEDVQQYTDDKVNNLEVGARNLLAFKTWCKNIQLTNYTEPVEGRFSVNNTVGSNGSLYNKPFIFGEIGQKYTFSSKPYAQGTTRLRLEIGTYDGTTFTAKDNLGLGGSDNAFTKYLITRDDVNAVRVNYTTASAPIVLDRVKIEKGDKATDWSPAPEDVQGNIDGVQNNLNNLEVGSVNLLRNTGKLEEWFRISTGASSVFNGSEVKLPPELVVTGSSQTWDASIHMYPKILYSLLKDRKVTLSLYARVDSAISDSAQSIMFTIGQSSTPDKNRTRGKYRTMLTVSASKLTTTWQRFTVTATINDAYFSAGTAGTNDIYVFVQLYNHTLSSVYVKDVQLEYGDKATAWSPAPEDTQAQIDTITKRVNITDDAVQIMENENAVAEFKGRSLSLGKNFTAQEIGNSYLWSGVDVLDFLAGFFQLNAITIGDPLNDFYVVPRMGTFPAINLTANHPTQTGKAYMQYDAEAHEFIGDVVVNGAIYVTEGDTVIERGVSGIWNYEKWASGHCELYGTFTKNIALTTPSGNAYSTSDDQTELLPFVFKSGVAVGNAVDKFTEAVTCHIEGQNLIWRPFRHQSSSATNRTYAFIIKGELETYSI